VALACYFVGLAGLFFAVLYIPEPLTMLNTSVMLCSITACRNNRRLSGWLRGLFVLGSGAAFFSNHPILLARL